MKDVNELRLNHNGKYIILSEGSRDYVESMLKWYQTHKEFFNGEFSIECKPTRPLVALRTK